MNTVNSNDGTTIAYDSVGDGPPVIIVAGALSDRLRNSGLAEQLAGDFTVYSYDRRGRGASGDARDYAVEREVEDLEALVEAAGGSAFVFGGSSGSNLALRAAVDGVGISRLALWEPNVLVDQSRPPLPKDYVQQLRALTRDDRRGEAVEYFLTVAVGIPREFLPQVRQSPGWPAQEALAHTLAYDGQIVAEMMKGQPISAQGLPAVTAPTLILDGATVPWITSGADALAAMLPNASRESLQGVGHDFDPEPVAEAVRAFLTD